MVTAGAEAGNCEAGIIGGLSASMPRLRVKVFKRSYFFLIPRIQRDDPAVGPLPRHCQVYRPGIGQGRLGSAVAGITAAHPAGSCFS